MEAYVPPGRTPFLPFGARSGWELLTALEARHGTSVFGYDLRPEKDLITECLALMQKKGYAI
ncbi:hypothetical protein [Methanoregula formicica]|uniref:Uncharacterized protein n=1 Tax=Methanoregula formicica (strain DSM 22288 / NBRC 105244 / SMSP) TaxID=593750 RepID=L0HH64_METFS|nr:hypothetical protein [Methanoregula formicica]AGB02419.1 hypothetical protein Metfor_1380 [Methanoregula formicica SMSP]